MFPAVHWVVQLNNYCPEDTNTYIHRVGRTARYEEDGKALLFLLPSEKEAIFILEVPPDKGDFDSHNPCRSSGSEIINLEDVLH